MLKFKFRNSDTQEVIWLEAPNETVATEIAVNISPYFELIGA